MKAAINAGESNSDARHIANACALEFIGIKGSIKVDAIHERIEEYLMKMFPKTARSYISYRSNRTNIREAKSSLMQAIAEISKDVGSDNANTSNSAASKMYKIAEVANKQYVLTNIMSPEFAVAHKTGLVYTNDLGYLQHTINCFYNPIGAMLKAGFDNGVGHIRTPKRIGSALAETAIILQSSQNDLYGGQGVLHFDSDLAPYAKDASDNDIYQALEAFVFNMNTMRSRSGAQVTFSSVNFGLDTSEEGRKISINLLKAFMAGLGKGENPIFPNLCFVVKDGVNMKKGDPNYDIFQLAIECMGKRIQPRFVFADSPLNISNWQNAGAMG